MTKDELREKVGTTFLKLYQTKYIADIEDLCQGENKVLLYLYASVNSPVFPSDMARDLLISKQRVTSVVNSLSKKGLCSLTHSTEDRRRVQIKITKLGAKTLEQKQEVVQGYFDFFIDTIGKEKIYELVDGLDKALDMLIEKEEISLSDNNN